MKSNGHSASKEDGDFSAIELAAADWLVAQDRGLTTQERTAFAAWLRADKRHAEVFEELDETWTRLDDVRETSPAAEFSAPSSVHRTTNRNVIAWLVTTAAVAAVLAFAWVSWPAKDSTQLVYAVTASTEIGSMRKLSLPDGSTVQLNTDTEVAVKFSSGERRVQLVRGEADFHVTHDVARPFIVSASGVAVRAVGTAFDVRRRADAVEVLVTEGKVRVNDEARGVSLLKASSDSVDGTLLVAGQRVVVSIAATKIVPANVAAVSPAEIGQSMSWQSNRLEFVAAPLESIVAEFNRYNRHKLVIADARLATKRFGGTFAVGDYDELVRVLESEFSVIAERGSDETKLRLAP